MCPQGPAARKMKLVQKQVSEKLQREMRHNQLALWASLSRDKSNEREMKHWLKICAQHWLRGMRDLRAKTGGFAGPRSQRQLWETWRRETVASIKIFTKNKKKPVKQWKVAFEHVFHEVNPPSARVRSPPAETYASIFAAKAANREKA